MPITFKAKIKDRNKCSEIIAKLLDQKAHDELTKSYFIGSYSNSLKYKNAPFRWYNGHITGKYESIGALEFVAKANYKLPKWGPNSFGTLNVKIKNETSSSTYFYLQQWFPDGTKGPCYDDIKKFWTEAFFDLISDMDKPEVKKT